MVAGDKSVSHRSIIFGSLAEGKTVVRDILEGEDVLATIAAFRAMGVSIERTGDRTYDIQGVGLHGLSPPVAAMDMGNSGTAFRLLTGLLCGQKWASTLIGDESLTTRPMGRIIAPLSVMGAKIESADGKPPLHISPVEQLKGAHYDMPIASAQVKSSLLFAGLYASGETSVSEPAPTRDHTERMLRGFGYDVKKQNGVISLQGGGRLNGCEIDVPADLSSATFFILAGLIVPDSELLLTKVGVNPSRNGVLSILEKMGANIERMNETVVGGEPVADLVVRSSSLKGCDISGDEIALAIDEVPAISIAAACALGITRITEAEELRVKESDRISSVVNGLRNLGVVVEELPDGMVIEGGKLKGGKVDSYGDHRIAMAFSIAGAVASDTVEVNNCANVATSFPDFRELANSIGLSIDVGE